MSKAASLDATEASEANHTSSSDKHLLDAPKAGDENPLNIKDDKAKEAESMHPLDKLEND